MAGRETARAVPPPARAAAPEEAGISPGLVAVLAAACGLIVANLYYAQPLLHALAGAFRTSAAGAATIVTVSQGGYAAGLLLVVPVGDLLERRHLVSVSLLLSAAALFGAATAKSLGAFEGALLALGVTSVVAQVLVPLAADLAPARRRGRVVGTVMSGLLLGILLARTLAGLVAAAAGWRAVYVLAGAAMLALAAALYAAVPPERPRPRLRYGGLLRSTLGLLRQEPLLRRRAALGALSFAAFSVLWTTLAFLLSGPPYRYGSLQIGLFGLVGAAGALCASVAGRLADRGLARISTLSFAAAVAASFGLMAVGAARLLPLVAGIVLLDIGCQGMQITNQSLIYRLREGARSRLTSVYMTAYFVGGAAGSAAAGLTYARWGWPGVCALGAALGLAMVALGSDRRAV